MSLLVDDWISFEALNEFIMSVLPLVFDPLTKSLRLVVGCDFESPMTCIMELKGDKDVR